MHSISWFYFWFSSSHRTAHTETDTLIQTVKKNMLKDSPVARVKLGRNRIGADITNPVLMVDPTPLVTPPLSLALYNISSLLRENHNLFSF